jgi:hypothetical protein
MNQQAIDRALAEIRGETDPTANSIPPGPPIPIDRPISWADWQAGRAARRATCNRVAPAVIRRERSSSDRRLKKLFGGERGPRVGQSG